MSNSSGSAVRGWVARLFRFEEVGVVAALLVLCIFLAVRTEGFLTTFNLLQVARQASYYGIMAVGMVFVLSMGEVDLSVGSILTLVSVTAAIAMRSGANIWLAVCLGLAVGLGCGLLNGLLSVALKIPSIMVTLGTLSVYRGIALVLSDASPIAGLPKEHSFFEFGGGNVGGVPASVIVMAAVGLAGWVLFNHSPHGWRVQAIGSNAQAARYSGIPIAGYRIAVMGLMGVIAAIAGLTDLAFMQSANPNAGLGFELWVIASAVIGGTALSGGSGSVPGAILGALVIAVIRNGLVLLGFSAYVGTAVTGAVIILAVAVDSLVKRRTRRAHT